MGKCKDCRHWEQCGDQVNVCCKMARSDELNVLVAQGKDAHGVVRTEADFGCIHFDERQQEPFAVRKGNEQHYNIMFMGSFGPKFGAKWYAQEMCDWLNDLWLHREEPEKKNCQDCKTFEPCPDIGWCETRYDHVGGRFSCLEWKKRSCENCQKGNNCFTRQFVTGRERCSEWSPK